MSRYLTASIVDDITGTSFMQLKKTKNGSILKGFSANIFYDITFIFNLSGQFILGSPLYTFPNGSINSETIVQLNTNTADLSLLQVTLSEERAREITFLQPTYRSRIQAFFRQPDENVFRNIIISPFQLQLWCGCIICWTILVISVVLIHRICKCVNQPSIVSSHDEDDDFSKYAPFWIVTCICQKSWTPIPRRLSLKVIFLVGFINGIIIFIAYSSTIISLLATKSVPITNFSHLNDFHYTFTAHEKSVIIKTFIQGLINSSIIIQREVVEVNNVNEVSHFIGDSKMAYLSQPDIFYYKAIDRLRIPPNYICPKLSVVDASRSFSGVGMFVRKGSKYREILNLGIIKMMERGLNHRYKKIYDRQYALICQKSRYGGQKYGSFKSVNIWDLYSVFAVICFGLVSVALLFGFEYLWKRN